jgi:hypothetical protein
MSLNKFTCPGRGIMLPTFQHCHNDGKYIDKPEIKTYSQTISYYSLEGV